MSYKVEVTTDFERDIKSLLKKYPSLKQEFAELIGSLENKPEQGAPLGRDCYKIRLAIKSKGRGKSGGARIITYVRVVNETVFLLAIYDKSEQENISDETIRNRLDDLNE